MTPHDDAVGKGPLLSRPGATTALAVAVLTALSLLPVRLLWLGMAAGDEGVVLNGALRVMAGQVPHRDFFSIIPPGTYYLLAGWMEAVGTSFASVRAFQLLCAVGLYALFLLLAGRLGITRKAALAGLPFLYMSGPVAWNVVSHHWLCDLALMASAACLLEGEWERRGWGALWAGALAGVGVVTLQDQGGYWLLLASAVLVYEAFRVRSPAGPLLFGAGAALVTVPLGAYLWAKAGFGELWRQMVRIPLGYYHGEAGNAPLFGTGWDTPLKGLQQQWGQWAGLLDVWASGASLGMLLVNAVVVAAPLLALGALVWRLRGSGERGDRMPLLLAGALWLAFLLTAFHRPALINLKWAFPPALLLVLLPLPEGRWRARWAVPVGLLLGVPLVAMLLYNGFVGPARSKGQQVDTAVGRLTLPLAGDLEAVRMVASYAPAIRQSGEKVFCYSYNSYCYYLLSLPNPYAYDNWNYQLFPQDEVARFNAALKADPPGWLILDSNPVKGDPLIPWFQQNYRGVATAGGYTIARYSGPLKRPK